MDPIVVHKYGGSSLSTLDKIRQVAARIAATVDEGKRVVAVVSAMGGTTDALLAQAKELSSHPNPRELDMLLSVGERISTALLGIALDELGHRAVSFTGSQAGIITNARHNRARIVEVRAFRVMDELDAGKVVIVAGYQGVSYSREITTLGRGGTDTTAVALAGALGAEYCEICSDVDGVYDADPRVAPDATRHESLDFETMLTLARRGAKVLHKDCVEAAARLDIALFAKATSGPKDDSGTVIRKNPAKVSVPVRSIAHRVRVGEIALADPDVLSEALDHMYSCGISASSVSGHPPIIEIALDDAHRWNLLKDRLTQTSGGKFACRNDRGTVSIVGHGLGEEHTILSDALAVSRTITGSTPEFRLGPLEFTLRVPSTHIETLVAKLHETLLGTSP